jgi:hypothetical protein
VIANAAIALLPSAHHRYEDRYRLLGGAHPRASRAAHGHVHAVTCSMAPLGMRAAAGRHAQLLSDRLGDFIEPRCGSTAYLDHDKVYA